MSGSAGDLRDAAIGCRAHTGWAAVVVVAGGVARPEVLLRDRVELGDPAGRIRRNAYQAARDLEPAAASELVEAAARVAGERAAAELGRILREAAERGAAARSCAVVVGALPVAAGLESILKSHVLAHAAEGRLYQEALLRGAESHGLDAIAISGRSVWEDGEAALDVDLDELRRRIDELRRELGAPWAEDQKLAAAAAWIALARSTRPV